MARLLDIHSQMLEEGLKQVGVAEFFAWHAFLFSVNPEVICIW
jgi:hypothetical protein